MALKMKIAKADFEALDETQKSFYKEDGENYSLDVEGGEDTGALKRALDRVREENKSNKELVAQLNKQIEELDQNDARKRGDIAVLEKSWNDKMELMKASHSEDKKKLEGIAKRGLIESAIDPIASKFKTPSLIKPLLKDRIEVDLSGDEPSVRILDKDHKPSAMTLADLEKEFLENKEYGSIIIGSKASGSAGQKPAFRGSATGDEKVDLSKLNPKELADLIKAKKEQN